MGHRAHSAHKDIAGCARQHAPPTPPSELFGCYPARHHCNHHCDSHRNLAWRPIPQPPLMGSQGGGGDGGEVQKKGTRGMLSTHVRNARKACAPHIAPYVHFPLRANKEHIASERGAESEVAHKWARWLHNPCRLGGPHRAGGRIRGGPEVGTLPTGMHC